MQRFMYTEVLLGVGLYCLALDAPAAWLLRWLERKFRIPGFGPEV